jgi:small-conductance mechanosensitive channel
MVSIVSSFFSPFCQHSLLSHSPVGVFPLCPLASLNFLPSRYYILPIVLVSVVLSHYLIFKLLTVVASRTATAWDDRVVAESRIPALWTMLFASVMTLLRDWDHMDDSDVEKIRQTFAVLLIITVIWWLFTLSKEIFDLLHTKFVDKAHAELQQSREVCLPMMDENNYKDAVHEHNLRDIEIRSRNTKLVVLRRLVLVSLIFIGLISVLNTFEYLKSIANYLLLYSGVIALAVGIAARPLLENLIANVQVALSEPVRLNDVCVIDGEYGTIESIFSTYVVFLVWDGRRVIVPMSRITNASFENWTRISRDLLGTVVVWVDFRLPIEPVRQWLKDYVSTCKNWDKRVCSLVVAGSNEKSMKLQATVSVRAADVLYGLRCDVREKLLQFLATEYEWALPRCRTHLIDTSQDPSYERLRSFSKQTVSVSDRKDSLSSDDDNKYDTDMAISASGDDLVVTTQGNSVESADASGSASAATVATAAAGVSLVEALLDPTNSVGMDPFGDEF